MRGRAMLLVAKLFRNIARLLAEADWSKKPLFVDIYRSLLMMFLPRGKSEVLVNSYRLAMRVKRTGSFADVGAALLLDGKYEPQTTELFKKLVKPGMRVIDIGANIGYFTLLASKLVGGKGKVWAFEPEKDNFQDLRDNVKLNGYSNVELWQKAVGDEDSKARPYLAKDSGGHSLIPNRYVSDKKTVEVDIVKLDSVIHGRVDIIKSDTKGNELAVLRGAEKLLRRNKDVKLFVEFHLNAFGEKYVAELIDLLLSYGFKYLYLVDDWEMSVVGADLQMLLRAKRRRIPTYAPNVLCSKNKMRFQD